MHLPCWFLACVPTSDFHVDLTRIDCDRLLIAFPLIFCAFAQSLRRTSMCEWLTDRSMVAFDVESTCFFVRSGEGSISFDCVLCLKVCIHKYMCEAQQTHVQSWTARSQGLSNDWYRWFIFGWTYTNSVCVCVCVCVCVYVYAHHAGLWPGSGWTRLCALIPHGLGRTALLPQTFGSELWF